MGRWARRLTVLLFLACSGYALGQATIVAHGERPERRIEAAASAPKHQLSASFTGFRDRHHPRGLDADDSARWSPRWGTAWKGGGRHPVWRGCRHVYDPEMTAFLNAPIPKATGSGA